MAYLVFLPYVEEGAEDYPMGHCGGQGFTVNVANPVGCRSGLGGRTGGIRISSRRASGKRASIGRAFSGRSGRGQGLIVVIVVGGVLSIFVATCQ